MSSISASLFDKDTITRPQAWALTLLVGADSLTAVARCCVGQDRIVCQRFGFEPALVPTPVRAVEEVVCANPLLLGDFRSVVCLVDTEHFLPLAMEDAASVAATAQSLWADLGLDVAVEAPFWGRTSLAMGLDPHLAGFLSRSFNNPELYHRLAPLVRHFGRTDRMGNRGKLYLNLADAAVDAIAFGQGGELSLLNSYRAAAVDDAVYFALLAMRASGTDPLEGEVLVSGAPGERREQFTSKLRTYAATVLPAIFPSEILAANPSMVGAPFELTAQILSNKPN